MKKTNQTSAAGYSSKKIAEGIARASRSGWKELQLSGCKLQDDDLRKFLAEPGVERLQHLDLNGNHLSSLPPEIGQLTALRTLFLQQNRLSMLSPEIGQLTSLTVLYLFDNCLTTLPPEIGQLTALTMLYLWKNQLSSLPPEIGHFATLRALDLDRNALSSLPPEIGQLTALTRLTVRDNRLSSLPPEIGKLTALTTLDLGNNQLAKLPPEIGALSAVTSLYIHGNNRLGIPPEILGTPIQEVFHNEGLPAKPADILAFYFRAQAEATHPLNEAKLVLIGDGEVGKTALVNLLVYDKQRTGYERQTQRIEIVRWQIERQKGQYIRLNLWDFGGQEIMHATHQFFLTERTLYLVVIDARRGQNESRLEYWLKLVESLAKDSPVIVVVNKIDEQPLKLDENTIRSKYGANVRDFAYISCETGEDADALRKQIRNHLMGLGYVDTQVPATWIAVKEKLEKTKVPWLTYPQYQEICSTERVSEPDDQRRLIRFLHDLGVMLSFFNENIQETRVLAPEWVTRGVYAIITSKQLAQTNGVLHKADLPALLPDKDYPPAQRQFIVDMMREFELCFQMEGTHADDDAWLIPGRLDENRPPTAELPLGALRFQYKYRVLPQSIISRFIVRTFNQLDPVGRLYWRNGIVLDIDGAKVRVIADAEERRIDIAVTGESMISRRAALTFVRTQFKAVHAGLTGMEPEERVPLPDHPEIVVPYKMLVDLERDPNAPKPYKWWHGGGGFVELDVQALVDGVETPWDLLGENLLRAPKPPGEVFLSYAHKDAKWRDDLMTMLASPLRGKLLEAWHDGKIKPSQEWRAEIEAALRRARVGVLLVSKHFLASDFIANEELPFLIKAAEKTRGKLTWMLISDALYEKEQFARLQALHDIAKPLSAFRGNARDKALKQIAQNILTLAR